MELFLLQAQQSSPLGGFGGLFFMGAILIVFWLFFIRPQAKKQKDQKKFIEDIQKGDKIVTIAGIHGKVNKLNDDGTVQMEVSPGSYIIIERSAISMEMTKQVGGAAAAEKK